MPNYWRAKIDYKGNGVEGICERKKVVKYVLLFLTLLLLWALGESAEYAYIIIPAGIIGLCVGTIVALSIRIAQHIKRCKTEKDASPSSHINFHEPAKTLEDRPIEFSQEQAAAEYRDDASIRIDKTIQAANEMARAFDNFSHLSEASELLDEVKVAAIRTNNADTVSTFLENYKQITSGLTSVLQS